MAGETTVAKYIAMTSHIRESQVSRDFTGICVLVPYR